MTPAPKRRHWRHGLTAGASGAARPSEALPPNIQVSLLTPAEWPELRDLRLRALADAPHALSGDRRQECQRSPRDWLRTFGSAIWLVARDTGDAVGVARCSRKADWPWQRHIEAVWVDPAFRRRGVARRLIEKLIALELRTGAREFLVWIVDSNPEAPVVYRRLGFRPTGESQLLPDGDGRREERMRLHFAIAHGPS